jgi:hypothetical protein
MDRSHADVLRPVLARRSTSGQPVSDDVNHFFVARDTDLSTDDVQFAHVPIVVGQETKALNSVR